MSSTLARKKKQTIMATYLAKREGFLGTNSFPVLDLALIIHVSFLFSLVSCRRALETWFSDGGEKNKREKGGRPPHHVLHRFQKDQGAGRRKKRKTAKKRRLHKKAQGEIQAAGPRDRYGKGFDKRDKYR